MKFNDPKHSSYLQLLSLIIFFVYMFCGCIEYYEFDDQGKFVRRYEVSDTESYSESYHYLCEPHE